LAQKISAKQKNITAKLLDRFSAKNTITTTTNKPTCGITWFNAIILLYEYVIDSFFGPSTTTMTTTTTMPITSTMPTLVTSGNTTSLPSGILLVPIPILVVLTSLRSEADNDGSDIPGEIIEDFEDYEEELYDIYDEYEDDLYDISDEFEDELTDIADEGIEEYEL
jgi:hypothetical protein